MLFVLLYSLIVKLRESASAETGRWDVLVKLAVQATEPFDVRDVSIGLPWFADMFKSQLFIQDTGCTESTVDQNLQSHLYEHTHTM